MFRIYPKTSMTTICTVD